MSTVPYYLNPNVPSAPSNSIFDINISTALPDGINWQPGQVTSIWQDVSTGAVDLGEKVVDQIASSTKLTYDFGKAVLSEGLNNAKSVVMGVTEVGTGVLDNVFGSISKYFLLIAGALIVLVYVAGKSGALKLTSVM